MAASPTVAMVLGLLFRLWNPAVEVLIFISIEYLTRLTVPKRRNSWNNNNHSFNKVYRIKFLTTQASLLAIVSVLCAVFHHMPYVLAIVTTFVITRLLSYGFINSGNFSQAVSKPLRSIPESEDTSCMEPLTYNHNHHKDPKRPSVPAQMQSGSYNQNMSYHAASWPGNTTSRSNISEPFLRQQTNTELSDSYIKHRTSNTSQSERVSQGRHDSAMLNSHDNSVISSVVKPGGNSLQRHALTSTQSNSQIPTSSSLFCHGPGYFSSFLDYRPPSKTPPGLTNPGNTCFINSTLQCLTWTEGFVQVIPLLSPAHDDPSTIDFLKALNSTLHQCRVVPDGMSSFKSIDTASLLSSISNLAPYLVSPPGSGVYQSQQDAAEFLLWILDQLHGMLRNQTNGSSGLDKPLNSEEIDALMGSRKECLVKLAHTDDILALREPLILLSEVDWKLHWQEYCSTLYSLFLGQLIEARECQQCKKVSVNVEYFTVLSLPVLAEGLSNKIDDSFQRFSEVEDLTHSNMMHCSCAMVQKDSLTPGKRLALLSKPPQRLVIQLTRYSYDSVQNEAVKNTSSVSFPLSLQLSPHTMEAKLNVDLQMSNFGYKLCAFCIHTGALSTSFGHYVAYAMASDGRWYCFNDSNVWTVDNIESELQTSFVEQNAYMLFYSIQKT